MTTTAFSDSTPMDMNDPGRAELVGESETHPPWCAPFSAALGDRRRPQRRNRAASPPVTARWSKVSDRGSMRCIRSLVRRTAARISTDADDRDLRRHDHQRGMTARDRAEIRQRDRRAAQFLRRQAAFLHAILEQVDLLSPSCGVPARDAQHGHEQAVGAVDGNAEIDRRILVQRKCIAVKAGVERRFGGAPRDDRPHQTTRDVLARRQASISASSCSVA